MNATDKRKFHRHRSLLPVKVRMPGTDKWFKSMVFNLSRAGACFSSNLPCSPNEKLEINVFQIKKLIPASVVWCQPVKDVSMQAQGFKVGIEYSLNMGHYAGPVLQQRVADI